MRHDSISSDEWTLVQRYLLGEASPVEAARAQVAIRRDPKLRALHDALRTTPAEHVPEANVVALKRQIDARRARLDSPKVLRRNTPAMRGWIAAGAIGAAAAMLFFVTARTDHTSQSSPSMQTVYKTTTGQQSTVTFHDGTRVTLAPETRMQVSTTAAGRTFELDGEAYFAVQHATSTPLVVRTRGATTRVLGTEFVVSQYARDARTRVFVTSGKVSVSATTPLHRVITLAAGQGVDVSDSAATTLTGADSGQYTGWMRGYLVFNRAPTRDVLAALGRWYGYEFRLADPTLATQNLTAALSTQSSASALSMLKLLLGVDLAFNGNVVTLTPRTHEGSAPVRTKSGARDIISSQQTEVGR